jgi:hypothetical protein
MASSHNGENEMLPITWPFRAAGTVMILTTVWFCMGWGIRDLGPEERLTWHIELFWAGIALTVALCIIGGIANLARERKRKALVAQH